MTDDDVLPTYVRVLKAAEENGVKLYFLIDSDDDERYGIVLEAEGKAVYLAKALQMLEAPRARIIRTRRLGSADSLGVKLYENQGRTETIKRLRKALTQLDKAGADFDKDVELEAEGTELVRELEGAAKSIRNAMGEIDRALHTLDDKDKSRKDVPIAHRLFYGFLAREGVRKSEATGLRWDDLDLERGTVRLDENKTDDPRTWMLDPDVSLALVLWRKRLTNEKGAAPSGESLVFAEDWTPEDDTRAATHFRQHLEKAGVKRAELFEETANRKPIRLHDLRATFVTLALANDKTEAWVCDRTGHRSSQMVNRYRRSARTAAELNLGPLTPLYRAIPELSAMVPDSSPPDPDGPKRQIPEMTEAQMQRETTPRNCEDAFRFRCRKTWGFKSLLAHHNITAEQLARSSSPNLHASKAARRDLNREAQRSGADPTSNREARKNAHLGPPEESARPSPRTGCGARRAPGWRDDETTKSLLAH